MGRPRGVRQVAPVASAARLPANRMHLSCGCSRVFPGAMPESGSQVYCIECNRGVYVVALPVRRKGVK